MLVVCTPGHRNPFIIYNSPSLQNIALKYKISLELKERNNQKYDIFIISL